MSRWVKWTYSVIFFLLMCGLVAAGTYQYKDNLSIPYNINIFGCSATASCTSMTLQNSGGTEIFTASNPGSVTLTNSNVTLSGSPVSVGVNDGSDSTQGAKADSPLTSPFNTGSVVAALKGILANVLTPISVTGTVNTTPTGTPQNVTVSNQATVNAVIASSPVNVTVGNTPSVNNTPQGSPQNVTLSASPVSVAISTVSSPVNVTGTFTANSSSPTTVNLNQIAGNQVSSPTSYGVAPSGSVAGVNAFVTNSPTVVLSGSPVSVGIAAGSSPVNVTGNFSTTVNSPLGVTPFSGASPQNVTFSASPVSVAISTVSSPVNVTGTFTANSSSPTNVNLDQINGQLIASPQTYGTANVGSVMGVNAFVTNNVNVTTPTPLNVTVASTPLNVTIAGPTPIAVTLPSTPVSVAISTVSSPVNVTGNFSATVSSPLGVIPFNGASPQNVSVSNVNPNGQATMANSSPVVIASNQSAIVVTGVNITQVASQQIASPTTYGVAPVGSVLGVNAFVTSLPGTPLNVTFSASPVSVAISTVSSPVNVTGTFTANSSSPTNVNLDQINGQLIASPQTYGTAPVGSVMGVNAFVTSLPGTPLNVTIAGPTPIAVTLPSTPVSVAISTVSSPVNVTGTFTANSSSPTNVNLDQINGQLIASPQSYGTAPNGSVMGVNAFVTNNVNVTTPTPLNVTIASTPLNVTIGGTPLNVTLAGPTPLAVTLPSTPVLVAISTVSSPVNVTGTFTANSSSPTNVNLDQINGQLIASPQTYGVAPVGSVLGVNAFVTNNVNVTTPTPLNVTIASTPLNVTIGGTPLNVTLAGPTPLNVTIATGTNITQIAGNNIASPTGYGTAPVGSVQGVNAFVTNNVAVTTPTPFNVVVGSPLNVTISGPTPLAVTLPSTPVLVAISTVSSPVNVTGNFTANSSSPTTVNLNQIAGNQVSSPTTYGVAPVGSVLGVNAFVTSLPGTPLNVTISQTPLNITVASTPLNVTVGGIVSPQNVTIASTPLNVTIGGTPLNVTQALPLPDPCSYQAKTSTPFAVPLTGGQAVMTQIATGTVGQNLYICSISGVANAAVKISIVEGVGTNCSGAPTGNTHPIWGASPVASGLSLAANGGWVQGAGIGVVGQTTQASNSVCVMSSQVSTSQYFSGNIVYVYK